MSLHKFADMVAKQGRGDDSLLIHMTPDEVQRLQAFAEANGRSLTVNPHTGLPEAGMLSDLFKAVAPVALGAFLGPAGAAIGGGFMSAGMAGLTVGGITTLATGSLSRGLMAGMGAYGGAGLAEGFMNAGTGALSAEAGGSALANAGLTGEAALTAEADQIAQRAIGEKLASAGTMDKLGAGLEAITKSPETMGTFAKNNFGKIAAAASPIMAGAMVPTTTKFAEDTNPAYIRQKLFDPRTQRYTSLAPVKAADWGARNFSDAYTNPSNNASMGGMGTGGMATGGIVALAGGGVDPTKLIEDREPISRGQTVQDLYATLGKTPDKEGLAFWQNAFGTGNVSPEQAASFMQAAQQVKQQDVAAPAGGGAGVSPDINSGINTLAVNPASAGTADTSGINALAQNMGTTTAGATTPATTTTTGTPPMTAESSIEVKPLTPAETREAVNNMYRNVLGRDADAVGLDFWSSAIQGGRSVDSVYRDFVNTAADIKKTGALGNFDIKLMGSDVATKPYTGYTSAAGNTVADEWVRNVLGREATAADRAQSWYKDADKIQNPAEAAKIYNDFKAYATKETGSTTGLNWMAASQLKDLSKKPVVDDGTVVPGGPGGPGTGPGTGPVKETTTVLPTNPQTNAPPGTTNPYGNKNNPGDLTFNNDGTITVTPNIPGRPYGGFSGMNEVKNAYTAGGGSLGYTSPVVKTIGEHEAAYNRLTGDSQDAYNYLMGKGAYPTRSSVASTKRYTPRYLASNASGAVTSSTTNPNASPSGATTTPSAQSINVRSPSGAVVTAFLGSDGTYRTVDGAKYDVTGAPIAAEAAGGGYADGGMAGYAMGGGLGSLGSYSDGGRLLRGPGDGVSDSIPATIGAKGQPARLADGEFVVPARIVSELGNGSTEAGARKLYAMMDRVQKARGKTTGKGRVAANTKADKHLPA